MRALLSTNWKAQSVSFQMINHQATIIVHIRSSFRLLTGGFKVEFQ